MVDENYFRSDRVENAGSLGGLSQCFSTSQMGRIVRFSLVSQPSIYFGMKLLLIFVMVGLVVGCENEIKEKLKAMRRIEYVE